MVIELILLIQLILLFQRIILPRIYNFLLKILQTKKVRGLMRIYIVGVSCVVKSTIEKILSVKLGYKFVDLI